jgi:hypothetical protein
MQNIVARTGEEVTTVPIFPGVASSHLPCSCWSTNRSVNTLYASQEVSGIVRVRYCAASPGHLLGCSELLVEAYIASKRENVLKRPR